MHDATEIESRGTPAVVLGTEAFGSLAAAASAALGRPHLAVVTIPHPLGGLAADVIRGKADAIVDTVLAALTTNPATPPPASVSRARVVDGPDDLDEFQRFALEAEWGDGLPVLPPLPDRVRRILKDTGRAADEVIAALAPRLGAATVEVIAVNAALAGAGPEHLPLVIAAVGALARPEFNLNAIQTTTHPCTPLLIVNGPIAERLGLNAGANALGQGHRANAVVGRAVRLVLQNVGGARPGREDRATLGHPGKYSYCLAENERESPWEPLSVERGFGPGVSTVTVCASEAPHNVNDHGSSTAEALLCALARTAATTGSNNIYLGGEPLVVLGPEHAGTIAASGWSKHDLRRALYERARVPLGAFSEENRRRFAAISPDRFRDRPLDEEVPIATTATDIMVIVAGGPGKHSAMIPTFGATRSVTVPIEDG